MTDCRHRWEQIEPDSDRVNCILCDHQGTVLADVEQALGDLYQED